MSRPVCDQLAVSKRGLLRSRRPGARSRSPTFRAALAASASTPWTDVRARRGRCTAFQENAGTTPGLHGENCQKDCQLHQSAIVSRISPVSQDRRHLFRLSKILTDAGRPSTEDRGARLRRDVPPIHTAGTDSSCVLPLPVSCSSQPSLRLARAHDPPFRSRS